MEKTINAVAPEVTYTHAESGLVVKDKAMYEAIMKFYAIKRLEERRRLDQLEAVKKREELQKIRDVKIAKAKVIRKELKPIEDEYKAYLKRKDSYQTVDHRQAVCNIQQYETEIKKLTMARDMIKKNITSFKIDSVGEFTKKFPFKDQRKLNNLRAKLYRLNL